MKFIQKYYYVLTGIATFIFYLTTIAPSVIQIDSGELAAVLATLGIAHPTGYPLFTILGYLFTLLPLPFSAIFQLNLLASLYCAIAVSLFTYTAKLLLDNLTTFQFAKFGKPKSKKKKNSSKNQPQTIEDPIELSESIKIISSVFGGLFLASSKTFWFQSVSVEVYSLHLLLITLIILTLFKAFILTDKEKIISIYWIMFAIALALGFTNHMTTLLIIPGVAYLYFTKHGINSKSIKQILFMLLIFFPILILVYSYLPIRASQNPMLNWGNPIDWEKIIRHISGHQYQVWLFSSTEAAAKQFNYFIGNLPKEFSLTLILVMAGVIVTFLQTKKFFIFNIIVFLSTVLYSINYDINDIDSYFLLAYISLSFFAVFGISKFISFANSKKMTLSIPVSLLIILFGFQFYSNFNEVNQTNNYAYEDYTKELLNSVPKNSIIFSYQWDYFISASYYFQNVEQYRNDVSIVDKELLRRSWYYNQLETNYPAILKAIKPGVTKFLEALKPFERDEQFDPNLLENLFRKIMTGLVATNVENHDFFIAPEIVDGEIKRGEFQFPQGYYLIPHLLLYKVVNTTEYVDAPLPEFKIRFANKEDKYTVTLKSFVTSMLIRRGMYELKFNKIDQAKIYAKKVAADFPNTALPTELARLVFN